MKLTPKEAVTVLLGRREDPYVLGAWDCAEMTADYVKMLSGDRPAVGEPPLTVWKVMRSLGRPDRACPVRYGDVCLFEGGLLIDLLYAYLGLDEDGGMCIMDLSRERAPLRWSVERWARY